VHSLRTVNNYGLNGTDALFDLLFEVKAKLVVEFRFYSVTAEQRS
jgi:hypothetical protein